MSAAASQSRRSSSITRDAGPVVRELEQSVGEGFIGEKAGQVAAHLDESVRRRDPVTVLCQESFAGVAI